MAHARGLGERGGGGGAGAQGARLKLAQSGLLSTAPPQFYRTSAHACMLLLACAQG